MQILLIEDDTRVATLIRRGLEEWNVDVTLAYDGDMGIRLALQHQYDLVITDIVLPRKNGIDVCRALRAAKPSVPLLMLTALGTTDDKLEGFDAGADDYLVKPFDLRELMARIKALLKRKDSVGSIASHVLYMADLQMNTATKVVTRSGQDIHLTPKEFRLLQFFLQNPGRVISRTELAENVWETHFDTGTNFIDVYINYLRKKIDKPFSQKLIHTKPGMGFILKEHENP